MRFVISKPAEGTLSPIICIIDKDVEKHRSQDSLEGNPARHWTTRGHSAIHHNPLSMAFQSIPYPQKVHPSNPYLSNLEIMMGWGTISKALQKSRLGRHDLAKAMLAVLDHLLIPHVS